MAPAPRRRIARRAGCRLVTTAVSRMVARLALISRLFSATGGASEIASMTSTLNLAQFDAARRLGSRRDAPADGDDALDACARRANRL